MNRVVKPKWLYVPGLVLAAFSCPLYAAEDADPAREVPGATMDASTLSKLPRLLHEAKPAFPVAALAKEVEAEIKLLLDLDDKGQVVAAMVLEPKQPTELGLEDAATVAAYQLSFEPAEIDGKPVAVQITYRFQFIPPKPAAVQPAPLAAEAKKAPAPTPVKNFAGILRERGTRAPLNATVITVYRDEVSPPVGFEYTTDDKGGFAFFDLAAGPWKVVIEAPGHLPFRTTEEIRAHELTQATYFVERASYNAFDVLIEAARPRKEVTRVVIDSAIIDQVPGAMGDALTALQNFAGVARVPAMDGNIIVRGSAPTDTKVFVDGIEIPMVYHFSGLRSVIPTGMIESLDFYPGNFSPYYGRATGGVIDVSLKRRTPKRCNGYVDVNLLDSGFFVEAPVTDKLTVAAAARRSYMDFFLNAVLPDNSPMRLVTPPAYYDYQVLADYRPSAAHDLRLLVFGSDDQLAMLFKNAGEPGAELSGNRIGNAQHFQRALMSYRYVPGEHFENAFRLSVGRDRFDQVLAQFVEHLYDDSVQLRDTARFRLANWVTLVGGVDAILQHWTAHVRMPVPPKEGTEDTDLSKTTQTDTDEKHWLPGALAEAEVRPTADLLVVPGVRFDYFSKIEKATLGPRLTARLSLNSRLALKAAVGLYHQEPTVDQSNEAFGNPHLDVERAIHYALGVEWKPRPTLGVDVTGFYKDLDHLVSETSAIRSENGVEIPLRYDNRGVGRVVGMELVVRRDPVHRFSGWLAYTLSRSERLDSAATSYRLFQYDQTHILAAIAMLRLAGNWQVSSRFRLVSGKPATPVIGAVNNLDVDDYKPIYGAKYAQRNPMFAQWDLRVDKKWVFDRFLLNAYLDVQNVTNRTNVEEPDYNFDYRKVKSSTSMPLYPILGLRAEF